VNEFAIACLFAIIVMYGRAGFVGALEKTGPYFKSND
jgi:acid phosphatase family membrane protein YuiD